MLNVKCRNIKNLTSKTADPATQARGSPPKVLKWRAVLKGFAISCVVITAARGKPFPIPFAMVTISGTTPCPSKPQKWVPVLPKPVWTSSEMHKPPLERMSSNALLTNSFGNWTAPPAPWIDSIIAPANPTLGRENLRTLSSCSRYFSLASHFPSWQLHVRVVCTGESLHREPPQGPLYTSGTINWCIPNPDGTLWRHVDMAVVPMRWGLLPW